jgi:hypothetical protein
MDKKKPYSAPQLFRVELNHEQAIISACSLTSANLSGSGNARCQAGGCKNVSASAGGGDSAGRAS